MLKYKINVLESLKAAGFSSYALRKQKILGESTLQCFRSGEVVGASALDILCGLLNCQPGDIIEYVPDCPARMDPPDPEASAANEVN